MEPSIIAASISGLSAVAVAVVGGRQRRHNRELRETVHEVRDQVSNTHSTNLREDIDRVLDGVEGIRNDLRQERADRRAGDGALVTRIERLETTR